MNKTILKSVIFFKEETLSMKIIVYLVFFWSQRGLQSCENYSV